MANKNHKAEKEFAKAVALAGQATEASRKGNEIKANKLRSLAVMYLDKAIVFETNNRLR